jgi:lysophospholipid acyltransferase (LPLAT)-like uncharacterized protein
VSPKKSWWKRTRRRWTASVAGLFGPWALRALAKTWRLRLANNVWESWPAHEAKPVFAIWHANIPVGMCVYRGRDLAVMISRHHDGEVVSRIAERMGFRTARGSTYDGATAALREMIDLAKEPRGLVITPDGPRGPANTVAPGAAFLAAAGRRKLIACGFASSRAWYVTGSWDRMMIPKPFARVVITFGEPQEVPRSALRSDAGQAEAAERLRAAMEDQMAAARAELAAWTEKA